MIFSQFLKPFVFAMIFCRSLGFILIIFVLKTKCEPSVDRISLDDLVCNIDQAVLDEIHGYQNAVNDIIELFTTGNFKGKTYDLLAELTDTFGPRMTGSQSLEDAIDWVVANATLEGFTVYTENFSAPNFVRNEETLRLVTPRDTIIAVLGLGATVGTPPEGIVAELLVVSSFEELNASAAIAPGKIVLFDAPFTTYGETIEYRANGAIEAAKVGAVASLIRSVADFSMVNPHTGIQFYDESVPKIPTAAITVEDATFLHRLQDRGEQITLHLTMGAENLPDITTRNTIIDTVGSVNPEEVVVVSGHLDSWDVGVGAMDDGGGVTVSWMASRALKELSLTPRRTFRTILFSAEEQRVVGSDAYFVAHELDKENFQLMMESDGGTFTPYGIDFTGTDEAACLMKEIVSLTALIDTTAFGSPADTPDLEKFQAVGVPIASLNNDGSRYFWYHHSNADRIDVYTPETLDKVGALWTAVSYVAADVSFRLLHQIMTN